MKKNEDNDLEKFLPPWYLEMRKLSKNSKDSQQSRSKARDIETKNEYTNLIRRREKLKADLITESQKIEKIVAVLDKILTEDPIERILRGESAEQLFEATGVKELDFVATKQKMLELNDINLRLNQLIKKEGK